MKPAKPMSICCLCVSWRAFCLRWRNSVGRVADLLDKFTIIMDLDSKQKGNLTELKCITSFYELGYSVSIPYGENSRYDFIADINGKLIRVQCKTSREIESGVIGFSCRSCRSNSHSNIRRKYTKDEIDYFCTYWNCVCYLVPVQECSAEKKLRLIPPKNNQKAGVNYAYDYEIQIQIDKIIQG